MDTAFRRTVCVHGVLGRVRVGNSSVPLLCSFQTSYMSSSTQSLFAYIEMVIEESGKYSENRLLSFDCRTFSPVMCTRSYVYRTVFLRDDSGRIILVI